MAKHRIVRRPSAVDPSVALYEVEEQVMLDWWMTCGTFDTFEEAEKRVFIRKKQESNRVERKVIRIYE